VGYFEFLREKTQPRNRPMQAKRRVGGNSSRQRSQPVDEVLLPIRKPAKAIPTVQANIFNALVFMAYAALSALRCS
jgi:hypothetical protein